MTSIAPSPAAEEAPRISSDASTRRCRAPKSRTAPMFATSTPTVWASQKSTFGPVTTSKVRRFTSGQMPVARKYAPCREAIRAFAEASVLNDSRLADSGQVTASSGGSSSVSHPCPGLALGGSRDDGDALGAHPVHLERSRTVVAGAVSCGGRGRQGRRGRAARPFVCGELPGPAWCAPRRR